MTAPISIVIPTLNAQAHLPACLAALTEGLPEGLIRELIVTDGGSTDETRKIADAVGAEWVSGDASRGGQLRRGVAAARGHWVMVLHADTVLEAGWSKTVAEHIRGGDGGPAYFRLAFRSRGLMPAWVAGWANLRARVFGLPFGDQGILMTVSDYRRAGGYPDQPLMEDVALAFALSKAGKRPRALPVRAMTSAAAYKRDGWLRRGAGNLWRLVRYCLGADPTRLARGYSGDTAPQ
ncbi:TIGR04283 family arsenosugar biosynthesis glycosyltransferase [Chachezhania antarctica]|uniref:TIGR04283 family arsenosugar biosynthesis glycosyltransferase n=1 Tax=Chachezhania antarctica TaxID=2340860 RepID=UPI000EB13F59|nr:TIGR04283 family arsenosugar biosynthesis glycosyltransferase [Chachezhania antarctica]